MKTLNIQSKYFNLADTLSCGQVFRYTKSGDTYQIISADKVCYACQCGDVVTLQSTDLDYFHHYFDLGRDYGALQNKIIQLAPELRHMAEKGKGIRILNQNTFEMIISFIISANNNIQRITKIINGISQRAGDKKEWGYAFPTYEQLCLLSQDDYKSIGAGYRAGYLSDSVPRLTEKFVSGLAELSTPQAMKELIGLKGVGAKVADCIMLFGLGRGDTFPVDTWMEQALMSEELSTPTQLRNHYIERLGDLAGLAQQYVFHYKRNLEGHL